MRAEKIVGLKANLRVFSPWFTYNSHTSRIPSRLSLRFFTLGTYLHTYCLVHHTSMNIPVLDGWQSGQRVPRLEPAIISVILNNVKPALHHKAALGLTLLRIPSKIDKPINTGIHVQNVGTQFPKSGYCGARMFNLPPVPDWHFWWLQKSPDKTLLKGRYRLKMRSSGDSISSR